MKREDLKEKIIKSSLLMNEQSGLTMLDADKVMEVIDECFDDLEKNLVLENIAEVDERGHLTDYPQFGRFEKGKRIGIYTKEID